KAKANNIFLRAFEDCVKSIIRNLPTDVTKREAAQAIQTIAQQLNGDYSRLAYVNEVIQARIWEDEIWAVGAAVDVYEMLARAIDPNLSIPDLPMRGPYLVRNELMRSCQSQFQRMMTEADWSRRLTSFLGQLCTVGNITSTTPGIALHVLDSLVSSLFLNPNDNFDHLVGFLMHAGPYPDGQPQLQTHLAAQLLQLQDRAQELKVSSRLAVHGSVQLRERGWRTEVMD
ncbi:hypothetical protein CC86DRAFT_251604, partial [Ophiobolus disseminans]